MPWFKVDDNLGFHHKVVAAGNPAMGLWVRAGSICAQQLTDGFVPNHMVAALGTTAQAERLVAVGLWDHAEGGYTFHGWEERQPSKAHVEAERAAAADRMRAHRERKRSASQNTSPQASEQRSPEPTANERGTNGEVRPMFGNPDPTRPDPTHKEQGRKRPATSLPADFQPNETNQRIAAERGVDLTHAVAQFRDHHQARDARFVDWNLALNTWLRREKPTRDARLPVGEGPDDWMRR